MSKNRDDKEKLNYTFSSIYYLQLIITLLVTGIYIIYAFFIESSYFQIEMIQLLYMISVAFDINWLFCGLQKFKFTVTRSGIIKILSLILIFLFVKDESDLNKYIFILAGTTLLNQMILWPFLKKEVKFVKVSKKDILKHLKPTLILFIPVLATSIYKTMDKIMIGNMSNMSEVGYYENAEKMLNIIMSVIGALGTVTLPQMTYLYSKNNKDEFKKIFEKSIMFIFFIVFPVMFGFWATADDLVNIYLGNGFSESAILLKLLSISLIFSTVAAIVRMQLLIPRSKDKEYIVSVILGAIINFFFNMMLIGKYKAIGATIGTILAEAIVCIVQCYYIRKEINIKKLISKTIPFIVKSLVMFIVVVTVGNFIEDPIYSLIIQILIGVLLYGILNFSFIKENITIFKYKKNKNIGEGKSK